MIVLSDKVTVLIIALLYTAYVVISIILSVKVILALLLPSTAFLVVYNIYNSCPPVTIY